MYGFSYVFRVKMIKKADVQSQLLHRAENSCLEQPWRGSPNIRCILTSLSSAFPFRGRKAKKHKERLWDTVKQVHGSALFVLCSEMMWHVHFETMTGHNSVNSACVWKTSQIDTCELFESWLCGNVSLMLFSVYLLY